MTLAIPSARSLQPGPVGIETITTTTIAPPFQPLFKWSESLQINSSASQSRTQPPAPATPRAKNLTLQKLVDFALVLRTDCLDPEHDNLYARVDALRVAQPAGQLTISPSNAGKLTYFPVAVAIETKTGMGNTAEGHLQLGAWAASWHRRMFLLAGNYNGIVGSEDVSSGRAKRLTTLPLIFVNGAEWQLYLAIDESSSIQIHGPSSIGNTRSVEGMYILLSCLHELAQWVEEDFKQWFADYVDYCWEKNREMPQ
ncbi:hypothetical protein CSOJ01_15141 [Colletotrichum sojae]|uniref:PD-(D/E)XK nuclease-like domain-containing protein n=1 Tax=Colletotrichum sojae TaxID=2175907 RepID=A0A8H6IN96_9PEZI|nr:hypothetical protein CSOJ01_15141 [Colletotrichum sojae]